jgi:phage-related protein
MPSLAKVTGRSIGDSSIPADQAQRLLERGIVGRASCPNCSNCMIVTQALIDLLFHEWLASYSSRLCKGQPYSCSSAGRIGISDLTFHPEYSRIGIMMEEAIKPVAWIGSSKRDLLAFPPETVRNVGHALYLAQCGDKPPNAKPLKGFGGASVLEIILNEGGDAYRSVYTVRFEHAVCVLHCFQKKAKSGIATPQQDIDLVKSRLRIAEEDYRQWLEQQKRR